MASLKKLFDTLDSCVVCYYKGTSLPIDKKVWGEVLRMCQKKNYWEEIPTEALVKQLDTIEAGLCKRYKSDEDGFEENDVLTICQEAVPELKPEMTLTLWCGNIACLLQRGVIQNDNMNGWLSTKIDKRLKNKVSRK